jgi:threonine dehydrogenase-like Zn-dependent dehydrogenase
MGATMRAAILTDGKLRIDELPMPIPGKGQILVRSLGCGICASDIHFMDNPQSVAEDTSGLWNYDPMANIVMGHEVCAEIVDYGPDTAGKWRSGTRVGSVPVLIQPNVVRILGYSADATGGFGEYLLMSEVVTYEVHGELPSELVAVSDAMAVGWYYVRKAAMSAKEAPLVIGCGAIGISVIAAMRRRGIGPIVAADFNPVRRELAKVMGADQVIDPAALSPHAGWRAVAYGSADIVRGIFGSFDLPHCVAFECVGLPGVLERMIRDCEPGTRILSAGGCPSGDHIPSLAAHNRGLNIQFGGGPSAEDWKEALDEVCSGRIDVRPVVGEVVTLANLPAAFERARSKTAPARIVVQPNR